MLEKIFFGKIALTFKIVYEKNKCIFLILNFLFIYHINYLQGINKIKTIDNKDKLLFKNKQEKFLNLNHKNLIHICMALDNNQIYSTLISIISALENNNKEKNFLIYYLLLSYDFNTKNIEIFENLKNKYPVKFNYFISYMTKF